MKKILLIEDDRVGAEHDLVRERARDGQRLLARNPERVVRGLLAFERLFCQAALDDAKDHARLAEQLVAARRAGGEDKARRAGGSRVGHGNPTVARAIAIPQAARTVLFTTQLRRVTRDANQDRVKADLRLCVAVLLCVASTVAGCASRSARAAANGAGKAPPASAVQLAQAG